MKDMLIETLTDESLYEAVRFAAYQDHCSVSELLRRALQGYLAKRKGKGKP